MPSFTSQLLTSDVEAYNSATTSPFLTSAAAGKTDKTLLGRWLANDRLYIHAYIKGTGRLLDLLAVPDISQGPCPSPSSPSDPETKLLDWLVDALVNVRREENFFLQTGAAYGIDINLPAPASGVVAPETKLPGLLRWEELFTTIAPGPEGEPLPWLEGAVLLWGTEICYLDAWTGVKKGLVAGVDPAQDADGGALRKEFIDNWTNQEFVDFVNKLRDIIDEAVEEQVKVHGEEVREKLLRRGLVKWKGVLEAEKTFWPA